MVNFLNEAAELVERLRDSEQRALNGVELCAAAVDLIEWQAERINHLTNVNDGLRETLDKQREGLAELRAMVAPEQSA